MYMLLYESAFLTTLKQKDAVEITQMMANFLSNWLASGPQLPARLPGDSVATNGDSVKGPLGGDICENLPWQFPIILGALFPAQKSQFTHSLTNLQLFWEQKMGDLLFKIHKPTIMDTQWHTHIIHMILLMEEILHHLGCINLVNNGISYQPQLVQEFSHQQYVSKI